MQAHPSDGRGGGLTVDAESFPRGIYVGRTRQAVDVFLEEGAVEADEGVFDVDIFEDRGCQIAVSVCIPPVSASAAHRSEW